MARNTTRPQRVLLIIDVFLEENNMVIVLNNDFESQTILELSQRFSDYFMYVRTGRGFVVVLKNPAHSIRRKTK